MLHGVHGKRAHRVSGMFWQCSMLHGAINVEPTPSHAHAFCLLLLCENKAVVRVSAYGRSNAANHACERWRATSMTTCITFVDARSPFSTLISANRTAARSQTGPRQHCVELVSLSANIFRLVPTAIVVGHGGTHQRCAHWAIDTICYEESRLALPRRTTGLPMSNVLH